MTEHVDVIVVGAGPAGLSAAIAARSAGLSVRVVERMVLGGELPNIGTIRDFPGGAGRTGQDLADALVDEVEESGAELAIGQVDAVTPAEDGWRVTIDGEDAPARGVVLATGSELAKLGVEGEDALLGSGISTCAMCDAPMLSGRRVAVVGATDAAVAEAEIVSQYAAEVVLVAPEVPWRSRDDWRRRVLHDRGIRVIEEATVVGLQSSVTLEGLEIDHGGVREVLEVDAVFPAGGWVPRTEFDTPAARAPDGSWQSDGVTPVAPNLLVVGDCRTGASRTVAGSMGEGVAAGRRLAESLGHAISAAS